MRRSHFPDCCQGCLMVLVTTLAQAEILGMLNYESEPKQCKERRFGHSRRGPKVPDVWKDADGHPAPVRSSGASSFNRDQKKVYITGPWQESPACSRPHPFPYRMKTVETPDCQVLEDIVFSQDNRT